MDHPTVTHVSLCAGYGGIDLGLHRCISGLRTIAYSEIEAFACELLLARMEGGQLDAAPIWSDLKRFPWDQFRDRVDVLSGGYPCQPFSSAGKRQGKDDPRHLWPFVADGIARMRPRVCFFENVEGHITLGLREVLGELESLGYQATWGVFSAAEVGAPHQRKRVFILAHANGNGDRGSRHVLGEAGEAGQGWTHPASHRELLNQRVADSNDCGGGQDQLSGQLRSDRSKQSSRDRWPSDAGTARQVWPSRPGEQQFAWEPRRVVGNASCELLNRSWTSPKQGWSAESANSSERQIKPALGGNPNGSTSRMDYAELCVSDDNRTDELRLLGNGVVPATAELAFCTLWKELSQ